MLKTPTSRPDLLEPFLQLQGDCSGSGAHLFTCLHAASFAAYLDEAITHDLRKFAT